MAGLVDYREWEEIENGHYQSQLGVYFSLTKKMKNYSIAISNVKDTWYNQAYSFSQQFNKDDIKQAESFFREVGRLPCFYVINNKGNDKTKKILEEEGYRCVDEEGWMILKVNDSIIKPTKLYDVKIIKDGSESEKIKQVYRSALPGPEVEIYMDDLLRTITEDYQYPFRHFLIESDGVPSSIGSAFINREYCYLYNLCTIEDKQRQQFMKNILSKAYDFAKEYNCKYLIFQTEYKTDEEKYFKKIGFETTFTRLGYVQKELSEGLTHR